MECPIAPKLHPTDPQEDCHEEHCPSPRVGRGLTSPAWLSPPDPVPRAVLARTRRFPSAVARPSVDAPCALAWRLVRRAENAGSDTHHDRVRLRALARSGPHAGARGCGQHDRHRQRDRGLAPDAPDRSAPRVGACARRRAAARRTRRAPIGADPGRHADCARRRRLGAHRRRGRQSHRSHAGATPVAHRAA